MRISQAEFRSDVWVPGLKNFQRSGRIDAAIHHAVIDGQRVDIKMFTGEDAVRLGAAASALVIVVPNSRSVVIPEGNIDFMHGEQPELAAAVVDVPAKPQQSNGARR